MHSSRSTAGRAVVMVAASTLLLLGSCTGRRTGEESGVQVLMLAARHWGLNNFLMWDVFDRLGWQVTLTGVGDTVTACPYADESAGLHPIVTDRRVADLEGARGWDAVVLTPGAGNAYPVPDAFEDLVGSPGALALLRDAVRRDVPLYAMCSASRVLAAAGVVGGRRMVGSPRFAAEYEAAGSRYEGNPLNDNPPTVDGSLITGTRGQYYNEPNCLALAATVEERLPRGRLRAGEAAHLVVSADDLAGEGILWSRRYGGAAADGAQAFVEAPGGGWFITGFTFAPGRPDPDLLALRVDEAGELLWARSFGGPGAEYGLAGLADEEGFLAAGTTTSAGAGSRDVLMVRFDPAGRVLWSRTWGGRGWEGATALAGTADGYLIGGYTNSSGAGEEDILLLKTDRRGRLLWEHTYGGGRSELGNSLVPTADGGCLIGASTGTYGGRNSDLFLIKVDASGKEQWARAYGARSTRGYGFDWCNTAVGTRDGGVLLLGYTDSADIMDACAVRVDAGGLDAWSRSFGNRPFYDYATGGFETADGGFLVVGVAKRIVDGPVLYDNDLLLVRLEPDGSVRWQHTLGTPATDWAASVRPTAEGDAVVLGWTGAHGSGALDIRLTRLAVGP